MSTHDDQDSRDVSLLAIDQYLRWVSGIPAMSWEEEQRLLACVEQGSHEQAKPQPDRQVLQAAKQARERLVGRFQRLVMRVARKYKYRVHSMQWMDLIQEGNVGLLEALDGWGERSTGDNFAGYAGACIARTMLTALYRRDRAVRLPGWVEQAVSRVDYARGCLLVALGRDPSLEELAHALSWEQEKVWQVLQWQEQGQIEGLHWVDEGEEEEERSDFVQLFGAAVALEDARQGALAEALHQAIETALTPKQREVVRLRYGLEGQCHRQREIAEVLGLCEYSVQRHEYQAKARLREQLAALYGLAQEELKA